MYQNGTHLSHPRVSGSTSHAQQLQPQFGFYKPSLSPPNANNLVETAANRASANYRRSIHPPQSYTAHPLQRTNSNPSQPQVQNGSIDASRSSEHLLRRKTPNGTLSAGYDGTPVEWASKPHAMKHILLPVKPDDVQSQPLQSSTRYDYGLSPETTSLIQPPNHHVQQSHIQPQQQAGFRGPMAFGQYMQPLNWVFPLSHQGSGYDSVLDQNTVHQIQPYNYPDETAIPHVLQPSHQISLGPTASQDGGAYGSYLPNGSYAPYRPAALQDPRFAIQQQAQSWGRGHDSGHLSYPSHLWSISNGLQTIPNDPLAEANSNATVLHQTQLDLSSISSPLSGVPYSELTAFGSVNSESASVAGNQLYTQQDQITRPLTAIRHPSGGYGSMTNLSQNTVPIGASLLAHSMNQNQLLVSGHGTHSGNEQFKERVLSWAHGVYVNLLAVIQQAKKQNQQHRHSSVSQSSRPGIYPRPPRQPGWSASHAETNPGSSRRKSSSQGGYADKQEGMSNVGTSMYPNLKHEQGTVIPQQQKQANNLAFGAANGLVPIQNHQFQERDVNSTSTMSKDATRTLRRMSGGIASSNHVFQQQEFRVKSDARAALEMLTKVCEDGAWSWIDGMLLGGCLAYGLADYNKALLWYTKILELDKDHVEAISNLAATLLSLGRRKEAEHYWLRSVKLRPSFFEAVEHLIGLLCGDHRSKEAVSIIEFVESSLRVMTPGNAFKLKDNNSEHESERSRSSSAASEPEERMAFDYQVEEHNSESQHPWDPINSAQDGFGSSGYAIPSSENGRMLALIHAKGNMMYALGNNAGAAKAFEEAILIGTGRNADGISGLIQRILAVVFADGNSNKSGNFNGQISQDPILLSPDKALQTAKLLFPSQGDLPGLRDASNDMTRKAAVSTTSNSLLSLAKIFQDAMSSSSSNGGPRPNCGVRDILALYYLSLSLQPSPSTANNVGILLASVQHAVIPKTSVSSNISQLPEIPGVPHGSGIGLALQYYNYGLNLDTRHAHLYTNLGSLLKDIGQLNAAIKMYEQAVQCDEKFDIALANLANAVKDQGRISDAIGYYKRAVATSPDFAEAVCGLANALNSVCKWRGRGGILFQNDNRDRWHVDEKNMLIDSKTVNISQGWMKRVVEIVDKQLREGQNWGRGTLTESVIQNLVMTMDGLEDGKSRSRERRNNYEAALRSWAGQPYEGAKVTRMAERITQNLVWQWYQDLYVKKTKGRRREYLRPPIPSTLSVPAAPTVLPFHTFTCPLSPAQIREISQRNGLRISCTTLRAPWLPRSVYRPPPPPSPYLRVGYVSSDFNNHPLAHLMQSVFGFHNSEKVKAFCYATTASDNSVHRKQIEKEAPIFHDASTWSPERLVKRITEDGIHILINLNGYTRGARNEVFAARPAPIQMSFMGFAGTLGAEWCDYILADDTAIPPSTLRPWRRNVDAEDQLRDETLSTDSPDWIYSENIIFARETFFCCDHRQSAPDAKERRLNWEEEQAKRWKMRKELFPNLSDSTIIFGNFNQLYKIEPTTFRTWLRILAGVPNSILWLLRFPELGESNLKRTAEYWAGQEVASRIFFTDVAPKHQHISRAAVCDLFLDTPECNAHTTAADVLWSGTPLLTLPRYSYKMCSRMAASILKGALPKSDAGKAAARELISSSDEEYERFAIKLGRGLSYVPREFITVDGKRETSVRGRGRLLDIRRLLFEGRWTSALFDTRRWVRDLEEAYDLAWNKWVAGEGGDIFL